MSDPDEDELVSVMDGVLDEFEPLDRDVPAPPDTRPDPVGKVAQAMVAAAVASSPEILDAVTAPGAVIILVAPRGWTDAIPQAWRRTVLGQPESEDADCYAARRKREEAEGGWPLGVGFDVVQGKDWARGDVARAFRTGRGVLACVDSLDVVAAVLRASADATVTINTPTPEILRQVAESLGDGAGMLVDEKAGAAMHPDHLLGCLRPGQSASAYLLRLERVAIQTIPVNRSSVVPEWTLDRIHGNPEVKAFGKGLALDMRAYVAGDLQWADVSPGVLLSGPPGCGKTITARALAYECGIRFFSTGYSEWQAAGKEGHSGDVVRCLRDRFRQARMGAPCILFLDELDSVRSRDGGAGANVRNDDWWSMVNNALLEELDGCQGHPGVVVVAASNYPHKIDPALRRSGRLDREIRLSPPDAAAISLILREHLGDEHLAGVDLLLVANAALGGSAADLASWVREAKQVARHAGRPMEIIDLMTAISPILKEPVSASSRRRTAYHEAGHAVAAVILRPGSVTTVSVRRGFAGDASLGGVEFSAQGPGESPAADVDDALCRLMAGRAAEILATGECGGGSGGPSNSDLAQATLVAASAELAWGMGAKLTWVCDPDAGSLGHILAVHRDAAVRVEERLNEALASATDLLTAHRAGLDAVAAALLEQETLDGQSAEAIVNLHRGPPAT